MVITRFAPSPTGHLHIGGLRTALYNYLHAKSKQGKFFLRIEDTDTQRNSQEALDGILEAFKWVGLQYDEPTLFQSQRLEVYQEYAQKLLASGHAYYCYLSKEELEAMRLQNRDTNHTNFSRKYRDFTGEAPENIAPCIRIKAPLDGTISFEDGIKGIITFPANEIDDFVILRSDGTPTYNFVVAIDDALSGITDLIRGDDHISNTPKQLVVYQALNLKVPTFYHIPMICNAEGKKLSKRDGAVSVLEYKEAGILPEALLNFLFRLGFSHGDQEIFSIEEMLACFNPSKINSKASACNFSKLYWLNAEYIKNMQEERLITLLNIHQLNTLSTHSKTLLLNEVKTRVNNIIDMKTAILAVLCAPKSTSENTTGVYDVAMYQKLITQNDKVQLLQALQTFKEMLETKEDLTNPSDAKDMINEFAHSLNFKPSVFMQFLRLGLLGKKGGIDLGACLCILGKNECTTRIQNFLLFVQDI